MVKARSPRIVLDDVAEAMERSAEDPAEPLLDLETGEVVWVPSDETADLDDPELTQALEDDPDRFLSITRIESHDEYRWMEAFARDVDDDEARVRLGDALAGRGAFGRFRAVLHDYPDLRARWFAVRSDCLADEARSWLQANDVKLEVERRVVVPRPVAPAPTPKKLPLRLAHVLALGVGDGTVIDGRTRRSMNVGERDPRELFKLLARDLCAVAGVDWRNRFIDGKTSFELDGIRISVEGRSIHVDLEIPAAVDPLFRT